MKISKTQLRALQSLLLAVAITGMVSLQPFASVRAEGRAPERVATASVFADWLPVQGSGATVTGTGQIKINGNDVQSGATVLSGSSVATGPDGDALIDIGPVGRIKLRPNTSIKVDMTGDQYEVTLLECTRSTSVNLMVLSGKTALLKVAHTELTNVAVTLGEVRVKPGVDGASETALKEGESRAFNSVSEIAATGDADFTVNCCDCDLAGGGFFFPPLIPILVFAGIGAGIPILINPPGEEEVSPVRTQ
jgi:hypothetical protein